MIKYDHIRLGLEKDLSNEINRTIQGDIILKLLIDARIMNRNDSFSGVIDSYNFKITKEMTPRLYRLFNEVKEKLQFSDDIDFYIINSPEMNAFALPSNYKEFPHRIAVNSTIIDRMDDDELRFVIGHEIGHLVTKTYKIGQMMRFIFQRKQPGLLLRQKYIFWEKLCELSADRFGLLANNNIEKSISSFFKLISGLPKNIIEFDLEAFIDQNRKLLDEHINKAEMQDITHPIPSLRVISLDIFGRSNVYKKASGSKKTTVDKTLAKKMTEVLQKFFFMGSETDIHRMRFIASAGLLTARLDKEIGQAEMNTIIDSLANFLLFPREFINDMIKGKDIDNIFNDSIANLLDPAKNRGSIEQEAEIMFNYLISIAVSDNNIHKSELDFINRIGKELFGFTKEKISYMTAAIISSGYDPSDII